MQALIAGAVVCAIAAGAQIAHAADSPIPVWPAWSARSQFDAGEQSFAARATAAPDWRDFNARDTRKGDDGRDGEENGRWFDRGDRWGDDDRGDGVGVSAVPEPSAWHLLALGAVGLGLVRMRMRRVRSI